MEVMKLQLFCLALCPVFLLLIFCTGAPIVDDQYQYAFIRRPGGIEERECYAKVNYTFSYKKYIFERGLQVVNVVTKVRTTKKCCPGHKMTGIHCLKDGPVDACHNLSCESQPNARCTIFKKCGQEIALFVQDGVVVENCHEPGALDILSCSGVCVGDPCASAECPAFNTNEVICFTSGCDCQVTWIRGQDGAEVNCQTGTVLTKHESRLRRRKRTACF